ncbi:MAG: glucosidase [Chloroflexaceae bacterium]|nr:glucosidase [Chloroflexaceae bacterium]
MLNQKKTQRWRAIVMNETQEEQRLREARGQQAPWKKWGPYLSERQWGTVREDYSSTGNAWDYVSHDQARARAYRWGEDGLGGICDDKQRLCFALALWNGHDPILKERLFGLTNAEGNHGEDVKEYYFYLDSTPTHSYMKYLYKYPHMAYPFNDIIQKNRQYNRYDMEYELLDTGIFNDNRYFDVFVEYAKASPEDILIHISIANRAAVQATLHVLPTIWFRNTWSWGDATPRPGLECGITTDSWCSIATHHHILGTYYLYCADNVPLLFTENETNMQRIFGKPNPTPFVKDGINNVIVEGQHDAVNPAQTGTKAAAHYHVTIEPGATQCIRLRLTSRQFAQHADDGPFGDHFTNALQRRLHEADAFYASITPPSVSDDAANVMRQALAGMLWTKQYYYYDVQRWLNPHEGEVDEQPSRWHQRNQSWFHMVNEDIISMPDTWEYPWYAAWDLAFHAIPLFMVDPDFAKQQLDLMLQPGYLHPNGQIPAYEWNFSDVNPPVHAWACYFLYWNETITQGQGDIQFLERVFQKLLLNFTWWINRKDPNGNNVFEGGFLGLDNIGVFDRSHALPTGGHLDQADGTAWMAFYSQMMLQMAIELAQHNPVYEEMACKFFDHFLWIVAAMDRMGDHDDELWDEADGFFYDVLRLPNGRAVRLKVRSLVGLIALCATMVVPIETVNKLPTFMEHVRWVQEQRPELMANIPTLEQPGVYGRRLLAILDEHKLRRVLTRMLDEEEFLSTYGIRSLSRYHHEHPYTFTVDRDVYRVSYEPAESTTGLFGGNSNWRGPIWMPTNVLIIRALIMLYSYYGDDFLIECPTGSGQQMNLWQVSREIAGRLQNLFLRNNEDQRPVYGGTHIWNDDPYWRDLILFYEYFHGDNGAGLGASHQTGWTGLIAKLIELYAEDQSPPV